MKRSVGKLFGAGAPPRAPAAAAGKDALVPRAPGDAVPTDEVPSDWLDDETGESQQTGVSAANPPGARPAADQGPPSPRRDAPATGTSGAGVAEPSGPVDGKRPNKVRGSQRKFL